MQPTELDLFSQSFEGYYNSTDLQGPELIKRERKAGSQTRKILNFFQSHSYERFTPFEIQERMNLENTPITSIRRAISDLTDMGYLEKTDVKRAGLYGDMNFTWRLR